MTPALRNTIGKTGVGVSLASEVLAKACQNAARDANIDWPAFFNEYITTREVTTQRKLAGDSYRTFARGAEDRGMVRRNECFAQLNHETGQHCGC